MAMNTGWITKMIDGVKTKVFAISHVKSTYYNYKEGVTLDKMLIETEDFNQEAVTEPEISPAILYEINEVAEASAASFSLLNNNKAESTDVYTIAEVDNLLGPVQEKLDTLGELATKDIVSENDLDSELLLKVNDIQTTTDTTLQGSKDGGVKLNHMIGKTEQKRYSGKNLFDKNNPNIFNGYIDVNTKKVIGAEHQYIIYIPCKTNTDYTVTKLLIGDNPRFAIGFTTAEPCNDIDIFNCVSAYPYTDITSLMSNSGDNGKYLLVWYRIASSSSDIDLLSSIQIEEGNIATDYESYVGGQPSPNPEYPQSLNHTGDCVEMMQGYHDSNTGIYKPGVATSVCNKYPISCTTGDKIELKVDGGCQSKYVLFYDKDGNYLTYTINTTESIVPDGATKFNFRLNYSHSITPETVGKIELTVNGKYVGQIVEHGKNLFNENTLLSLTGWTLSNGYYTGEIRYFCSKYVTKSIFDKFKENMQYTILLCVKTSITNDHMYFMITYSDGSSDKIIIGNSTTEQKIVIVTNADKTIKSITSSYGNNANIYIKDFLIQEGMVENPTYEPYTEHIETFYIDEPLRDGDRLVPIDGLWNVERNRGVLNSVDMSAVSASSTSNPNGKIYTISLNNYNVLIGGTLELWTNRICNRGDSISKIRLNEFKITKTSNGSNVIYFVSPKTTTDEVLTDLKAEASEIEYNLATPTYEVLDNQSQIALNSLKSFNGVTYVEFDSRVQPQEVSFDYGTSHVGARVIKAENDNLIEKIKRQELEAELKELRTALVALGSEV